MGIPTCGSFQGICTSTSQCATNVCLDGFCAGPVLPLLGAQCTPFPADAAAAAAVAALPCAFGANCYAVNSMLITVCGNFQSECSWDGQCAFNKCEEGFCSGPRPALSLLMSSSSTFQVVPTTTSSASADNSSPAPTAYVPLTTGPVPSMSVLYANQTAITSPPFRVLVTTTLVVGGPKITTAVVGGEGANSSPAPTQTATVQSGAASNAIAGVGALGILGFVMLSCCSL